MSQNSSPQIGSYYVNAFVSRVYAHVRIYQIVLGLLEINCISTQFFFKFESIFIHILYSDHVSPAQIPLRSFPPPPLPNFIPFISLSLWKASKQVNKQNSQTKQNKKKEKHKKHIHTSTSKQTKPVKTSSKNLIYKKKDNNPAKNSQVSNIRQKSTKVSLSSLCVSHLLQDMGPTLNCC